MHLGVFLPPIDPRPAGVGVFTQQICLELLKLHSQTTFFAERDVALPAALASVQVHSPDGQLARLTRRLPSRLLRRFVLDRWLPQRLQEHQVDVLFVPFHDGLKRHLKHNIKQAIVVHDLTLEHYPEGYSKAVRLYHRRVARPIIEQADAILAVSHNTARDLVTRWGVQPQQIHVIHEGYDARTFQPAEESRAQATLKQWGLQSPFLLYSGTVAPHKNLPTIVQALAQLKQQTGSLPVRWAITGRPDVGSRAELQRLAERLQVGEAIEWLGFIERPALAELMSHAAAFVYPSLYEGFGLSPLEAMACGARVLASNRASLPEVVGNGGQLLPPEDIDAWAQAIAQALSGNERNKWKERALAQANTFSWKNSAETTLRVLTKLNCPQTTATEGPAEASSRAAALPDRTTQ